MQDETLESIRTTCKALFATDQTVELRILGVRGKENINAAGWFNNHGALAEAATKYDQTKARGIYATVNPVHDGCIARGENTVQERIRVTTSDKDITKRSWLPIDIDPVRPSGVSSTKDEFENARTVAKEVQKWLEAKLGFPAGIRAASGNGIHLLYRIDEPNDDTTKMMIAGCLRSLNKEFSTPQAKIDTTMFNAARIIKVWGTFARKGESTKARPHRRSSLWNTRGIIPTFDTVKKVTREQLKELAGRQNPTTSSKRKKTKTGNILSHLFNLEEFISKHSIQVQRSEPFDGSGVKHLLVNCLFDDSHTGTSASLGRTPDGKIFYRCFHDSCSTKDWHNVREMFEIAKSNRTNRRKTSIENDAPPEKARVEGPDDDEESDNPWILSKIFIREEFTNADTGLVTIRRHDESYFVYRSTKNRYAEVKESDIKTLLVRWLGGRLETLTTRKTNDVLTCLSARISLPSDMQIPFMTKIDQETGCTMSMVEKHHWITMKNGILDLDALTEGKEFEDCLRPVTSNWFSQISLPYKFPINTKQIECDQWKQFLLEIMDGDESRVAILQETFGYCFFNDTSLESFVVMHGAGRNGKSTVLAVLRELLGNDNVTSLTLSQIGSKYLTADLQSKLANICPDMNEIEKTEEGLLKAVVSGDPIVVDRKYKTSMQMHVTAKLFFATNVLPRFSDTTLGIWRRMIMIPFNHVVPIEKVDTRLLDKLREELPGILLWTIEGLIRLREAKRFTKSETCEAAIREYRMQCFPILTFIEECTTGTGNVTVQELWSVYRNWCKACGLQKPKPRDHFTRDVLGFRRAVTMNRSQGASEFRTILYGLSLKTDIDLASISSMGTPTQEPESGSNFNWAR